jgi:hypothetical protein
MSTQLDTKRPETIELERGPNNNFGPTLVRTEKIYRRHKGSFTMYDAALANGWKNSGQGTSRYRTSALAFGLIEPADRGEYRVTEFAKLCFAGNDWPTAAAHADQIGQSLWRLHSSNGWQNDDRDALLGHYQYFVVSDFENRVDACVDFRELWQAARAGDYEGFAARIKKARDTKIEVRNRTHTERDQPAPIETLESQPQTPAPMTAVAPPPPALPSAPPATTAPAMTWRYAQCPTCAGRGLVSVLG